MSAPRALVPALLAGYLLASIVPAPSDSCAVAIELHSASGLPEAGQRVEVDVTALGCDPDTATVTILAGLESERLRVELDGGRGRADVPGHLTRIAGELTVLAPGASATIALAPGAPVDAVRPWVGPRTIVADGDDVAMAVAAPVDRYGNPVADGTGVTIHRLRQSGKGQQSGSTRSGLVWATFTSGTTADRAELWTTIDLDQSERVAIHEIPGPAAAVEIEPLADSIPAADGRSVVGLKTRVLADPNGNVLPDGIGGRFVVTGPGGSQVFPGVVTSGRLRAGWVVPGRPGTFAVTAEVQGRRSPSFPAKLAGAVDRLDASARITAEGVRVEVGPVRHIEGGLVADGTPVTIGGVTTALSAGWAEVVLAAGTGPVDVSVLGHESRVAVQP